MGNDLEWIRRQVRRKKEDFPFQLMRGVEVEKEEEEEEEEDEEEVEEEEVEEEYGKRQKETCEKKRVPQKKGTHA